MIIFMVVTLAVGASGVGTLLRMLHRSRLRELTPFEQLTAEICEQLDEAGRQIAAGLYGPLGEMIEESRWIVRSMPSP